MSRGTLVPWRGELRPALLGAALFGVAFPPFPPLLAVILCLVPVTVAVARQADGGVPWRAAARTGFWFGTVGYGLNVFWIATALSIYSRIAIPAYLATIGMLGALVGCAFAVLWMARRRTGWPLSVLLPIVWVTLELLLGRLPDLAFPWLPLALATTGAPVLSQLAELSGPHGVSLMLAATNGALADAWLVRHETRLFRRRVATAALAAASLPLYGAARERTLEVRALGEVAVVQPSIAQDAKWKDENAPRIVRHLATLTRAAVGERLPELIVWPEASLPAPGDARWSDSVEALASELATQILFGTLEPWTGGARYNSAMIADPQRGILDDEVYRKAHLVPVVEHTPFANAGAMLGVPVFGGYARGGAARPLSLDIGRTGVLICFESVFPERARAHRRGGAELLAAITNDAWFGWTFAAEQHLAHLVLRAVETRVGIVRAANTGITAYIDPAGRVHGPTARFTVAVPRYVAETTSTRTPYIRLGNWVGVSCFVALAAILLTGHRRGEPT